MPARGQDVPGFHVEIYANVTDPVMLSFDSGGTLFVGRDAGGSGGNGGDPVKIHKVGPGGSPVAEWGANAIDDPDAVVSDEAGVISGVPGSVLVGGLRYGTAVGEIHAVRPDQSVVLLYDSTQFQNIVVMKFDGTSRLVFTSVGYSGNPSSVFVSTGSAPIWLFTPPSTPAGLAFDAANNIYISCLDGQVRVYSAAGSLIDDDFATLASWAPIGFGVGGAFGTDLFAFEVDTGNIKRIDAQGNTTLFGTGFGTMGGDLAFGLDGALYASVFGNDAIYRITPLPTGACCYPDGTCAVTTEVDCTGVWHAEWTDCDVADCPPPAPPCFIALGDLPGGAFESVATALSADGTTVVGYSKSAASGSYDEAFRWRAATGITALGDLPGNDFRSQALGVSGDGSVVVGRSDSANAWGGGGLGYPDFEAFRWTEPGGIQGLGDLAGDTFWSQATGVSADGEFVVGTSDAGGGWVLAFSTWTSTTGMQLVGDLPGGYKNNGASSVSASGQWCAGWATTPLSGIYWNEAFRWSAAGGFTALGLLPGGYHTNALDVSDDGEVVCGYGSLTAGGSEGFVWTPGRGIAGLGDLPGGAYESWAAKTPRDGSIFVGAGTSASGTEAVLWDEARVIHRIVDVLLDHGVVVPQGWVLRETTDVTINSDVVTLCGKGTNPAGQTEAWLARYTLPPPTGACCFHDGHCEVLANADCTAAGGLTWTEGLACDPNPCTLMPGDCDGDFDVDIDDFADFVACFLGPEQPPGTGCECFDLDPDTDVDLADFAVFQRAFTGS